MKDFKDVDHIEKNYMKLNHYSLLGIKHNDSISMVRKSYYTLSKQFHPDIYKGSAEIFKKLGEAYSTLKDPIKREDYNKKLKIFSNFKKHNKYSTHRDDYKEQSSQNQQESNEEPVQTTSKYEEEYKKLNIDKLFDRYYSKPIKHKAQNLKVNLNNNIDNI